MSAEPKGHVPVSELKARWRDEAEAEQPVPELMGAHEVAAELGIMPGNLGKVRGLPEPVAELKRGRIWRASTIRNFAASRQRRATG